MLKLITAISLPHYFENRCTSVTLKEMFCWSNLLIDNKTLELIFTSDFDQLLLDCKQQYGKQLIFINVSTKVSDMLIYICVHSYQ